MDSNWVWPRKINEIKWTLLIINETSLFNMINIILKIELMYVEYQFKNAKKIRYTHIFRNGHQSKTVHQRHRNVFQTKT